jgi:hypothetical protein
MAVFDADRKRTGLRPCNPAHRAHVDLRYPDHQAIAHADDAHTLYIELGGLAPARDYWYRFTAVRNLLDDVWRSAHGAL